MKVGQHNHQLHLNEAMQNNSQIKTELLDAQITSAGTNKTPRLQPISKALANVFKGSADETTVVDEKKGIRIATGTVNRQDTVNISGRSRILPVPLNIKYTLRRLPAPTEGAAATDGKNQTVQMDLRDARQAATTARNEAVLARQNAVTPEQQQQATEAENKAAQLDAKVKHLEKRLAALDARAESQISKQLAQMAPDIASTTVAVSTDAKGRVNITPAKGFGVHSFKVDGQWYKLEVSDAKPPAAPKTLDADDARQVLVSTRQAEFSAKWRDARREMAAENKTNVTKQVSVGDQNFKLSTSVKYTVKVDEKGVLSKNQSPLTRPEVNELNALTSKTIGNLRRESANTGDENLTKTVKLKNGREFTVQLKADWQAELKSTQRSFDNENVAAQRPARRYQINNVKDLPKFAVTDEQVQSQIKESSRLKFNDPYIQWRDYAKTYVLDQNIQGVKTAFRLGLAESGDSKISQLVPIGSERYEITVKVAWDVNVKPIKGDSANKFTNADRKILEKNDYKFTDEQWENLKTDPAAREQFLAKLNKNLEKLREMRQEMIDGIVKDGKMTVAEKGFDNDSGKQQSLKKTVNILGQEYKIEVGADWSGSVKKHHLDPGETIFRIIDNVMPFVALIPGFGPAIAAGYGAIRSATQDDLWGTAMNLLSLGAATVFKGSAQIIANAIRQVAGGLQVLFDPNAHLFDKIMAGLSIAATGLESAGELQIKNATASGSDAGQQSGAQLLKIADNIRTISSIASGADIVLSPGMRDFDRILGGLSAISGTLRLTGSEGNMRLADKIEEVTMWARRGDQLVTGNLAPLLQDLAGWAIQEALKEDKPANNVVVPDDPNVDPNVTPTPNFDPAAIIKDRLVSGKADFGKDKNDFKFVQKGGDLFLKSGKVKTEVDVQLGKKLVTGYGDDRIVLRIKGDSLQGKVDGKTFNFKPSKGQMKLINNQISNSPGVNNLLSQLEVNPSLNAFSQLGNLSLQERADVLSGLMERNPTAFVSLIQQSGAGLRSNPNDPDAFVLAQTLRILYNAVPYSPGAYGPGGGTEFTNNLVRLVTDPQNVLAQMGADFSQMLTPASDLGRVIALSQSDGLQQRFSSSALRAADRYTGTDEFSLAARRDLVVGGVAVVAGNPQLLRNTINNLNSSQLDALVMSAGELNPDVPDSNGVNTLMDVFRVLRTRGGNFFGDNGRFFYEVSGRMNAQTDRTVLNEAVGYFRANIRGLVNSVAPQLSHTRREQLTNFFNYAVFSNQAVTDQMFDKNNSPITNLFRDLERDIFTNIDDPNGGLAETNGIRFAVLLNSIATGLANNIEARAGAGSAAEWGIDKAVEWIGRIPVIGGLAEGIVNDTGLADSIKERATNGLTGGRTAINYQRSLRSVSGSNRDSN